MAEEIAKSANMAASVLKTRSNDERTAALKVVHDALRDNKDQILEANKKDMKLAEESNYSDSLVKRLDLSKGDKYDSMLQGILDVGALEDPMGNVTMARHLDDGLDLYRVTCPIGVLLVIFEARPEVIANISALAIKSGNAAILKGGKESLHTFTAMSEVIKKVLGKTQVPPEALQLVNTREQVSDLLSQDRYIDLVIPRGSNELVRGIKNNTRIPVLGHADGICSIYLAEDAEPEMAARIAVDSKTNYPAGCNAAETLLVNEKFVAADKLVVVLKALVGEGVTCKLEQSLLDQVQKLAPQLANGLQVAEEGDFAREFLSLTIAVKTVPSTQDAITHINLNGSGHTDVVVTECPTTAQQFLKGVNSAGIYWNASSRFADGFRYGFGTEVGVSTNRYGARGPVGLEGLMTYQYMLKGKGQIAGHYAGAGGDRRFKHQDFVPDN